VLKEKVTKEKEHPTWRLPPIHGRQVREPGPGFSTAHPCAGEKESTSCRLPLRGLSSPSHRRTGAPVEQRAILARTLQNGKIKGEASAAFASLLQTSA